MAAALMLAACGDGVPMAPTASDLAAKRFEPPPQPSLAALYIVREGTFVSTPVAVLVDQRRIGNLAYDTYLRIELPPGWHDVRVRDLDTGHQLAVTNIQLGPGDVRFVSVANAVFDGLLMRTVTEMSAREMPGDQGRSAVAGRKLAATF
jgi:hypothetical protein